MAVSDILFDAVEAVRDFLKACPDTYDEEASSEIAKVVAEMDRVRAILDTPPSE